MPDHGGASSQGVGLVLFVRAGVGVSHGGCRVSAPSGRLWRAKKKNRRGSDRKIRIWRIGKDREKERKGGLLRNDNEVSGR